MMKRVWHHPAFTAVAWSICTGIISISVHGKLARWATVTVLMFLGIVVTISRDHYHAKSSRPP